MGPEAPFYGAYGLGISELVTCEQLSAIKEFYHSKGVAPRLQVNSDLDRHSFQVLAESGFNEISRKKVLFAHSADFNFAAISSGKISVSRVAEKDLVEWARVVSAGFAHKDFAEDSHPDPVSLCAIGKANTVFFVAKLEEQVLGAGALFLSERGAKLGGTSVLPRFRKLGVHGALISARVEYAISKGYLFFAVDALDGSDSLRNLERHGFQAAYARIIFQ